MVVLLFEVSHSDPTSLIQSSYLTGFINLNRFRQQWYRWRSISSRITKKTNKHSRKWPWKNCLAYNFTCLRDILYYNTWHSTQRVSQLCIINIPNVNIMDRISNIHLNLDGNSYWIHSWYPWFSNGVNVDCIRK